MKFFETISASFFVIACRVISGFFINKAIAIFIGPSGLAIIGQLQSFNEIIFSLGQGGVNQGVTKYSSEYSSSRGRVIEFVNSAIAIMLPASIAMAALTLTFSTTLSVTLFKSEEYAFVFRVLAITLPLYSFNSLIVAILNGVKDIRTWAIIGIIQSLYGLLASGLLILFFGIDGALLALVTNQSVVFVIACHILQRKHPWLVAQLRLEWHKDKIKKLLQFSFMTLTSTLAVPCALLFIRKHIGDTMSWEEAGLWQGMWFFSTTYLSLITATMSVYFLPRFAEITGALELRHEVLRGVMILVPLTAAVGFVVFLIRERLILLVFSEAFMPMADLFFWQLIGDSIKIFGWLLGNVMLAKSMTKNFVIAELIFSSMFVFLTVIFTAKFGLVGVTQAFALNYLIYCVMLIVMLRRYLFSKPYSGGFRGL